MSSCKSHGQFKKRHLSRKAARSHAERRQKSTNVKVEIYRCPDCQYWHVGRHKTTKSEKRFTITHRERIEDAIVGKLIGALKLNLNKEPKS